MLAGPDGLEAGSTGHLTLVASSSKPRSNTTVAAGVERPEAITEGRGRSPDMMDGDSMMLGAGGATLKELTPVNPRPGRPHGGATIRTAVERGQDALGMSCSSAPSEVVLGLKMPLSHPGSIPADRDGSKKGVCGIPIHETGCILGESLRSVISLCSQSTGREIGEEVQVKQTSTFPLPTDRELIFSFILEEHAWTVEWLRGICIALNSFWGCPDPTLQEQPRGDQRRSATKMQARILRGLTDDVTRLKEVEEVTETFDCGEIFSGLARLTTRVMK